MAWAGLDGVGRHAENHAGFFVLCQVGGTRLLHLEHSLRSIAAHSSHDYAYRIPARIARGRTE
jgi:hypothetical protein